MIDPARTLGELDVDGYSRGGPEIATKTHDIAWCYQSFVSSMPRAVQRHISGSPSGHAVLPPALILSRFPLLYSSLLTTIVSLSSPREGEREEVTHTTNCSERF